jgi:hypothetical protein
MSEIVQNGNQPDAGLLTANWADATLGGPSEPHTHSDTGRKRS